MELRPKYSLNSFKKTNLSAMREFTDREEPTKAFIHAYEQKDPTSYKVLTFYGVGGIGKSRLLRELYQKVDGFHSLKTVKALIDFKEEKHRTTGEALIWLREELKKNDNIKFTTFDLAYMVYWKKLNPQLSLKANDQNLPFLEEGSFIGEVIDNLENVPFAQWLPKTLKFVSGMAKYKDMIQWWMGRGKEVMAQLQDMMPSQIEEMLSVYWAADLKDYLSVQHAPAVIFIDTYEALWERNRQFGSFYEKDAWVQELVLQLPEVLWVICGREKIQWGKTQQAWNDERYLEQHLMGELSDIDCHKFLQSCGVGDEDIRNIIIEASHGLPYYLDLMVDTYNLISEKRLPAPEDFSKAPQQILDRFLRYLELPEKETLKILSFTRYWTIDLFQKLVNEFKTSFPLTAYLELFRFSFINELEEEEWDMHAMMRASLQEEIQYSDKNLFNQVHAFLFHFYNEKLLNLKVNYITEQEKSAFQEAFFHGKFVFSSKQLLEWFLEKGKLLKGGGQFQLLSSYHDEMESTLFHQGEQKLSVSLHQFFGELYLLQGKYETSIRSYEEAIGILNTLVPDDNEFTKDMSKCYMDLAEIWIHTNDYDKAYEYLRKAIECSNAFQGKKEINYYTNLALLYIRLGKLNIRFSRYEESKDNYLSAIDFCDHALTQKPDSKLFAMKALAYEKLGELYGSSQYEKQGECYQKSIEYYEKALDDVDEEEYMRILTNKGLAYKRLAEHYLVSTHPSEKIRSFQQAIAIYDQVLEKSPNFVDALEKKGHATVDYMVLQIELDLLNEAMESFHIAVETFSKVIELSPKQGGSRNRLASAYRELSKLYLKSERKKDALTALHNSLELSEETLAETPNYIYVFNSIGKTYEAIADIYRDQQEWDKAEQNYEMAVNNYDKMLEKAPELREPIRRKELIQKKREQMA